MDENKTSRNRRIILVILSPRRATIVEPIALEKKFNFTDCWKLKVNCMSIEVSFKREVFKIELNYKIPVECFKIFE